MQSRGGTQLQILGKKSGRAVEPNSEKGTMSSFGKDLTVEGSHLNRTWVKTVGNPDSSRVVKGRGEVEKGSSNWESHPARKGGGRGGRVWNPRMLA